MIGMTQFLFDEGLHGSFCLEPFRWLGAATVHWGQSLSEVTAFFANVAFSGGHFTPSLHPLVPQSMIGMTCSLLYCVTQILFDEGLRGSFCLEPFRWLGSATVQWD